MSPTNEIDERIERGLRALTAWEEGTARPALVDRALAAAETGGVGRRGGRSPGRSRWSSFARVGVVLLSAAFVVAMMSPSLQQPSRSSRTLAHQAMASSGRAGPGLGSAGERLGGMPAYRYQSLDKSVPVEGDSAARFEALSLVLGGDYVFKGGVSESLVQPERGAAASAPDRHVVRKATMELKAADTRGTFLKASLIPSAAAGEFVEDSALTGEGPTLSGNLTLRVAAERLAEVLNQLRELGKVNAEQVRGEDVTSQVVDLEARLRNERRVEQELLGLMDTRPDAPLKEVLELRDKLGEVRGVIEQLDAQQSKLSRLVSLATVLVLIRPADAPEPVKATMLTHLSGAFKGAWRGGVEYLINSGAWIVQVAIGGLLWWIVLVAGILIARRHLRRAALLRGDV